MPQYEQFGNRDIPFFGDYNSISAVGNTVLMDWTDQRDPIETEPGPIRDTRTGRHGRIRRPPMPHGDVDRVLADGCPNAGGPDENIFGFLTG